MLRVLPLLFFAATLVAQQPVAVLLGASPQQWEPAVKERGWRLVIPPREIPPPWTDPGAKALDTFLRDASKSGPADPSGAFLIGVGDGASAAFYLASRVPGLWRAVLAIDGNPRTAIESNRLFAVNTQAVPVLWVVRPDARESMESSRKKLADAGFNLEFHTGQALTIGQALDWLASKRRDAAPYKIDCETGSPAFARCYWAEIVNIDPARRNDALPSTRVSPGSGASLALGGFGFNPAAPGPGLVVGWLPEGYRGQLKIEDRIVSLGGTPIADAPAYIALMDNMKQERSVAVVVERAKQRLRLETRILLPTRAEVFTARLQAEFTPETRLLQFVSRGAAGIRFQVPAAWVPASVNWNGFDAGPIPSPGCWLLSDQNGPQLQPCP